MIHVTAQSYINGRHDRKETVIFMIVGKTLPLCCFDFSKSMLLTFEGFFFLQSSFY